MFTGIVKYVGKVARLQKKAGGLMVWVLPVLEAAEVGDSIAINGVCLTVEEISKTGMRFFIGQQSLKDSTLGKLKVGDSVNVEPALRFGDKVGGHLVSGHVHCVGRIVARRPMAGVVSLRVKIPSQMIGRLREKGSVAVDGVSLTVQKLGQAWFEVMIVPETLRKSVFSKRKVGDVVNIEFDF